jgi:DNA polymerase-1
MQNIPKKLAGFNIKKVFVPPEGHVLVNTDAKGAEIRIFAAYSQDEKLITAINDGLDTHSFFTANVFGETYEDVERARDIVDQYYAGGAGLAEDLVKWAEKLVRKRTNCKRVVFGTLYGAMAAKIAETAGISLEEAQEVIDLMFRMFPSIPAYIDSTQREVQLFRWVATKTGRKRRFPMANMRMFRNRCYRQAVNFKIQSTSSDIVLWVLNQIFPIIINDLQGQFHATVHDSIVLSVQPKYVTQVRDIMREYGTDHVAKEFPWLPVPFLWDVEVGPSYGEVADIEKYLQGQAQHDIEKQKEEPEEIISGEEIRAEINEYFAN